MYNIIVNHLSPLYPRFCSMVTKTVCFHLEGQSLIAIFSELRGRSVGRLVGQPTSQLERESPRQFFTRSDPGTTGADVGDHFIKLLYYLSGPCGSPWYPFSEAIFYRDICQGGLVDLLKVRTSDPSKASTYDIFRLNINPSAICFIIYQIIRISTRCDHLIFSFFFFTYISFSYRSWITFQRIFFIRAFLLLFFFCYFYAHLLANIRLLKINRNSQQTIYFTFFYVSFSYIMWNYYL